MLALSFLAYFSGVNKWIGFDVPPKLCSMHSKDEKPHANKRTLLRQGKCHGTTPPEPLLIGLYKSTKNQPTSKRDARVPASRSPATAF
jgi:hypothetical protein